MTDGPIIRDSAVARVLALHDQEMRAAQDLLNMAAGGGGYCDIWIESPGNGPGYHEKCPPNPPHQQIVATSDGLGDQAKSSAPLFSDQRMLLVRQVAQGGYADVFLETPQTPSFHENLDPDHHFGACHNALDRVNLLKNSNVLRAYALLKAVKAEVSGANS